MNMLAKFFNTPAMDAADMIHFSDEDILANSKGEVLSMLDQTEDEDEKEIGLAHTDIDPEIFGDLNEENIKNSMAMGHITLPQPILNVNYLYGTRPILPQILGITRQDIETVTYYGRYIIIKSDIPDYVTGQILDWKEYEALQTSEHADDVICSIGAKAIEELMDIKGINKEGIILHVLPVLPYAFRYNVFQCPEQGTAYPETGVSPILFRLIWEKERLARLNDLHAPEIIIRNEQRTLQEFVDAYINNGARGCKLDSWGYPYVSLQSYSRVFRHQFDKKNDMSLFENIDSNAVTNVLLETIEFNASLEDGMYEMDSPEMKKEDELMDTLLDLSRKTIMDIVEKRYSDVFDFEDDFVSVGLNSVRHAADGYVMRHTEDGKPYEVDKDKVITALFSGVIPAMDLKRRNLAFT